ncbi:MAG: M16 family metallopeptidase [Planctomycetota bacterium]|jgi:predicted Zn-dependent peptidase
MEFKKKVLPNGLSIIGEVNNFAKSAAVGFFIRTGARDETKEINGVSHFLEHMLFKGTEKLNAFAVNEAFDRIGAQFNAFTSEELTVFYAAVLPEYLQEVTELWIELMRPSLRNEDFSIEKNVIKEEIAMYQDLPSFDVMDKCRNLHFEGHPCGNSVLGKVESIENLTARQMRDYFGSRYAPNNMALVFAGNYDWEQSCSVAEGPCAKWQNKAAVRDLRDCAGSRKKNRLEKPNLSREHICLMSPAVSAQDERRFAAYILAAIIGDSVGSRFFWELVDKALAESATMEFDAMDGTGAFFSYISCSPENADKVLDIVNGIFETLFEKGVTEEEIKAAKNKILSAMVIKNEIPMGRLINVGFNWMYLQQYRTIEDDIKAVKGVSAEDIHSLIKPFNPAFFTQFSLGPAKSA